MSNSIGDPHKFIPKLLDVLRKAESKAIANIDRPTDGSAHRQGRFKNIEEKLQNMMNLPATVKHWEKTLFNHFTFLERRLYKIILGTESNIDEALNLMLGTVQQIDELSGRPVQFMPTVQHSSELSSSTHKSQPDSGLAAAQKMSKEWSQLGLESLIYTSKITDVFVTSYTHLESNQLKMCCLSLSIFPENCVIKKRPLIYWWMGEGFVTSSSDKTAEEAGEQVFEQLMNKDLIQPHFNSTSAVANNCTMHPWIRSTLISMLTKSEVFNVSNDYDTYGLINYYGALLVSDKPPPEQEDYDRLMSVFNVDVQYLSLRPEWLNKLKKVEVLQLGRWQNSPTYHIEVEDEEFLKSLRVQRRLKYFSLRGISRITQLPSSVLSNLIFLKILDLRACHNLEDLPADLSSLRELTHLDISECYLLDRMPKGLDKLSKLQVLEGFVIRDRKSTPCRLGDFAKLKQLRRLSIHIGNEAVVEKNEFSHLKEILSLRRLKISWGIARPLLKDNIAARSLEFSFPPRLEKLDLQAIPLVEVPSWLNPRQLQSLRRLYIRGGELGSLDHKEAGCEWKVEILRLKYLNKLEIGFEKLKEEFPHLQHLEKIRCHEIEKEEEYEDQGQVKKRTMKNYDEDIVWSQDGRYTCIPAIVQQV